MVKCPCCKMAELVRERIDNIKEYLDCPNCHVQFADMDEVQDMLDDIEWEQAHKHDDENEA